MAQNDSYKKEFRSLEGLVRSCNENGSLVPGHEPLRDDLAAGLEQTKSLKVQQEKLEGTRLAATDRFIDSLEEAKEKARKLRGFIISILGSENPLLELFGIRAKKVRNPNNRRRTRKAKPETPAQPPANPPAPEGQTNKPSDPAKTAA